MSNAQGSVHQACCPARRALPFVAVTYENQTIAIRRSPEYNSFVKDLQAELQCLQDIEPSRLRLTTRFEEFGDMAVQLSAGVWPDLVATLFKVNATVSPPKNPEVNIPMAHQAPSAVPIAAANSVPAPATVPGRGDLNESSVPFFVKLPNGKTLSVRGLRSSSLVRELQAFLHDAANIPPWHSMIIRGGKRLVEDKSLGASGVRRDCTLHVVFRLVDASFHELVRAERKKRRSRSPSS
ncbi:hypothetical protein BDV93DRAFT_367574 [Ceratobasidium sp. AG-I]|nr:hypothetical protein BDV93DRAFT_367574 [Ceratobasidium sp. AG-I]